MSLRVDVVDRNLLKQTNGTEGRSVKVFRKRGINATDKLSKICTCQQEFVLLFLFEKSSSRATIEKPRGCLSSSICRQVEAAAPMSLHMESVRACCISSVV